MDKNNRSPSQEPLLLGVDEVARRLGLGRSKVYELLLKRELTSLRVGRRRLVPRQSLDEFVAKRLAEDTLT